MGKIVLHASMSLDGYTAGPNVDMEHPMGVGGMWLHEWLFADPIDPVDAVVSEAMYDRRRERRAGRCGSRRRPRRRG